MRAYTRTLLASLLLTGSLAAGSAADNPYVGSWELTLPNGAAGWLGVEESDGQLHASLLWGGGSVLPVASAKVEDGKLIVTRQHDVQRKGDAGKKTKATMLETITATVDGDKLSLVSVQARANGEGEESANFSGRRTPPMPPAPDLRKVKYGKAIVLFNGKDLRGWRLTDPKATNGWSAKDGLLVNEARQEEGKPHKRYGNLRTDQEFEDFNLKLETRVGEHENSGVYIRGMYEVQVFDSFGKPLDSHNMGAIYSRIRPTESAEKAAGEWQSLDITFVERHVTVVLNGKKIIDNQPVAGCTGGALWSDVTRPGPIYLQGDHTGIEYRNLVLRPVRK